VYGTALQRFGFTRRHRNKELATDLASHLPLLALQLLWGAQRRRYFPADTTKILAFPIDRHGRCEHYFFDAIAPVQKLLQEDCRALDIAAHVLRDFVHRLTDTYGGRKVINNFNSAQSVAYGVRVAHVAYDEFCVGRKIVRNIFAMDLWGQIVEYADGVTRGK